MKEKKQVHLELMTRRNAWLSAVRANESKESIRKKCEHWKNYRDAIDPNLIAVLAAAMKWIKENHSRVYLNSSWTNCAGICETLYEYHGIGYLIDEDDASLDGPFVPVSSEVNPKSMVIRAYAYADARADKEIDILSSGGLDTSYVESNLNDIHVMLHDVKQFNTKLTYRIAQ